MCEAASFTFATWDVLFSGKPPVRSSDRATALRMTGDGCERTGSFA
jgi:hypothetical protein